MGPKTAEEFVARPHLWGAGGVAETITDTTREKSSRPLRCGSSENALRANPRSAPSPVLLAELGRGRERRWQQIQEACGAERHARHAPAARPDRILDRRGEDSGHWERARFADALEPQWVQGRERLEMVDDHGRHVGGGGQQVVHVGAGQELAALVVADLLEQRAADAEGRCALQLALDHEWIDEPARVVAD